MTQLLSAAGLMWNYPDAGDDECGGTVSIDAVDMHTPAWNLPDLSPLWGTPEVRGSDRVLPGASGVVAYRRRVTVTRFSLRFLVNGHWDSAGVEHEDAGAQLQRNMETLQDDLLALPAGDGTRQLVWTTPLGSVITADVHVLGLASPTLLAGSTLMRTTLELSAPNGDLHL